MDRRRRIEARLLPIGSLPGPLQVALLDVDLAPWVRQPSVGRETVGVVLGLAADEDQEVLQLAAACVVLPPAQAVAAGGGGLGAGEVVVQLLTHDGDGELSLARRRAGTPAPVLQEGRDLVLHGDGELADPLIDVVVVRASRRVAAEKAAQRKAASRVAVRAVVLVQGLHVHRSQLLLGVRGEEDAGSAARVAGEVLHRLDAEHTLAVGDVLLFRGDVDHPAFIDGLQWVLVPGQTEGRAELDGIGITAKGIAPETGGIVADVGVVVVVAGQGVVVVRARQDRHGIGGGASSAPFAL